MAYTGLDSRVGRRQLRRLCPEFERLMDFYDERRPLPPHNPVNLLRQAMVATCGRSVYRLKGEDWTISTTPAATSYLRREHEKDRVEGARVIWC